MPINVDHSTNQIIADDGVLDFFMTGSITVPTGTTAQRPSGVAGMIRYNTTLTQFEGFTTTWGAIGSGGGSVPVQDDGVEIVADPSALNFTGAGVTVTDVGGVATIDISGGGGSTANVIISDTAPVSPTEGTLWWKSDVAELFVWYEDGDSDQWVSTSAGADENPDVFTDNGSFVYYTGGLNVGIGTDTPAGSLSIASNNPNIRFEDTDTTNNGEITLDNTSFRLEIDEDNTTASSAILYRIDGSEFARMTDTSRFGILRTNPQVTLDVGGTEAIRIPIGTDLERPTGTAGLIRYNSDSQAFEGYTTEWGEIGGGTSYAISLALG